MSKGIVRKIDELGRITLPREYRKTANLKAGEKVGLYVEEMTIHIVIIKTDVFVGMTRPLDELGRIALPIEFRRSLNIAEKDPVDIYIDGEEICIRKEGCEWCSSMENLFEIEGHKICLKCALAVTDMVMEKGL